MRDKLLRIKQIVRDGMLLPYLFTPQQEADVLAFVMDNAEYMREVSLGAVKKVADFVKADPVGWLEMAEATCLQKEAKFKRLLAKGQEVSDIAQRLSKSQGHIRNMLALVAAEPEVRQAVVAGRISATEAAKVVKANGSQAGTVIAKATEHARSEGRERARPRDVEAVTKPRTEPVSLCSLAIAVVKAWQTTTGLDEAVAALANHLGPLAR